MIIKNYSKQILGYLTKVVIPQTSKEILENTNIPKEQITVYLNRLKNSGKIYVAGKRGQFNLYHLIGDLYESVCKQSFFIYGKHKDAIRPFFDDDEKTWYDFWENRIPKDPNLR